MLPASLIFTDGSFRSILAAAILFPALLADQPATQPSTQPPTQPVKEQPATEPSPATPAPAPMEIKVAPAATPPAPDSAKDTTSKEAKEFLLELERADTNLRSLQADIRYDRIFEIAGDRQVRIGKLYFTDSNPGSAAGEVRNRKFAVRFDQLQLGRRVEKQEKTHIFDGEWYIEKTPAQKLFAKRRIVAPGEKFDPLKIGQGPFPIPVGQKRDDILSRFTAEIRPATDGLDDETYTKSEIDALKAHVKDSVQIHLVPKTQVDARVDLTDIRLWYLRKTDASGTTWLLPRLARTLNTAGDIAIVQLLNVEPNTEIPADVLDTSTPEGWSGQVNDALPVTRTPATQPAAGSGR